MATPAQIFTEKMVRAILRLARKRAIPAIPSRTLRRALQTIVTSPETGKLFISHYWALYVHDGRGAPFGPRSGLFMVWFKNPRQDPRLIGGVTPERANQLRSLRQVMTKAQFRAAKKAGRIIFAQRINKPVEGSLFFQNEAPGAQAGLMSEVRQLVPREFSAFVKRQLGKDLNFKQTVTLTI